MTPDVILPDTLLGVIAHSNGVTLTIARELAWMGGVLALWGLVSLCYFAADVWRGLLDRATVRGWK